MPSDEQVRAGEGVGRQREDITCPLCGDTGFDGPGFVGHIDRWCEEVETCRDELIASHRRTWEIARAAAARAGAKQ